MCAKPVEAGRVVGEALSGLGVCLDFLASQSAWWWCILCARSGNPWAALLGPLAYLLGNFVVRRQVRSGVLRLAVAGALFGWVGDALLVRFGFLAFPPGLALGGAAPFMLALWAMFAVSLLGSTAFVVQRPAWLAIVLGGAAGPLAYVGGERLSVLSLSGLAPFAVAAEWAGAVSLLALIARRLPEASAGGA